MRSDGVESEKTLEKEMVEERRYGKQQGWSGEKNKQRK